MVVRRWIRIGLWVVAIGILVSVVVGAGFGIALWRQTTVTTSERADADKEFDKVRARFGTRPPLVDIREPGPLMPDIRLNKAPATAPRQPVKHFHALFYDFRNKRLVTSRVPIWWMELSGESMAVRFGLPIADVTITVEDVERYGPGVITDFSPPGGGRILVWTQ